MGDPTLTKENVEICSVNWKNLKYKKVDIFLQLTMLRDGVDQH